MAEITYVMLVAGSIVFTALALIEAAVAGVIRRFLLLPARNIDFLVAVLYQGIGCSVLAFFLSNVAISKIGVNRTSTFIGVATVVSVIAGALLLSERFMTLQIVGAVVIVAGVCMANARSV